MLFLAASLQKLIWCEGEVISKGGKGKGRKGLSLSKLYFCLRSAEGSDCCFQRDSAKPKPDGVPGKSIWLKLFDN